MPKYSYILFITKLNLPIDKIKSYAILKSHLILKGEIVWKKKFCILQKE